VARESTIAAAVGRSLSQRAVMRERGGVRARIQFAFQYVSGIIPTVHRIA